MGLGCYVRGLKPRELVAYALLIVVASMMLGAAALASFVPRPIVHPVSLVPAPLPSVEVDEWAVISENARKICAQYHQQLVDTSPPRAGSAFTSVECGTAPVVRYRVNVLHRVMVMPSPSLAKD